MSVLERLEQVRWSELRAAHGEATSVPDLLRALAHGDASTQTDPLRRLDRVLFDERGELAEASAYVVPFLIELVCAPSRPRRTELLAFIARLAEGARRSSWDASRARSRAATRAALCLHADALGALVSDREAEVRGRAAIIASSVTGDDPRRATAMTSLLSSALRVERDPATRVAFAVALGDLQAFGAVRSALDDRAPAVQLAAALALLAVDEPGDVSFRIVQAALESPVQSARLYGAAARYRPLSLVASVCAAGARSASGLLPALLSLIVRASPDQVASELAPVLELFFADGADHEPTKEQSTIALSLATHLAASLFVPAVDELLGRHGLPSDANLLRSYGERGPSGVRPISAGARRLGSLGAQDSQLR